MSVLRRKELARMLEKIGFTVRSGHGKHLKYEYLDDDECKRITVPIPKGRKGLPKGTVKAIRDRLRLNFGQFEQAVKCPFKHKHYERVIREFVKEGKL